MTDLEQQRVEEILSRNQKIGNWSGKESRVFSLTGIITCGACGRTMKCEGLKQKNGKQFIYYQCKNYKERACHNRSMVRLDKAEQEAIARLVDRAVAITAYASTPPEYVEPPSLRELRSQLSGLELLGHNKAIVAAKNELRSQIILEVNKAKQQLVIDSQLKSILLESFSDPEFWQWDKLSDADKRQIYRDLVQRIVVRDGVVEKVELRV